MYSNEHSSFKERIPETSVPTTKPADVTDTKTAFVAQLTKLRISWQVS